MSTDSHGHGRNGAAPAHDDVSFEPRDVQARTIYVYLFVLAVAVVLSYVVCLYVFRATSHLAAQTDTPPPPVREQMGPDYRTLPPEPRLQGLPGHESDPQLDHRRKVEEDKAANERTGWIDQRAGIVQIPVRDAMKIIAEKGLPGTSTAPAEKK
jgi:hypothetical protein